MKTLFEEDVVVDVVAVEDVGGLVVGEVFVELVEESVLVQSFGFGFDLGLGSGRGREASTSCGWRRPCVAGAGRAPAPVLAACGGGDEARGPWPPWCLKSLVDLLLTPKKPPHEGRTKRKKEGAKRSKKGQRQRGRMKMSASFLFVVSSSVVVLLDRFLLAGATSSLPKQSRSRGGRAASGRRKGPRGMKKGER